MRQEKINYLQDHYPPGTSSELEEMKDPYDPVPSGTKGTVLGVDDAGTIEVAWDNGRSLGLIPGEDSFQRLPPELATLKLYMPLFGEIYEKNEYGWEEEPYSIDGRELVGYDAEIEEALINNRLPEEKERGVMAWYSEEDTVNEKVQSVEFETEYREGQLWGVARCRVMGNLTPDELDALKEHITGQAADGWGEGFEQREIRVAEGILNVHLWNSDDWSIQTEEDQFGNLREEEGMSIEPCF